MGLGNHVIQRLQRIVDLLLSHHERRAVSFRGILYPLMAEEPRHPGGVGTGVGHGHPVLPFFRSNICT